MPAAMIQGAPAYYWERDYDRITQALSGLNRMLDEKRKEKERRMARDMAMLQNDPRLAAGPAGKQFMETYADDPQAVAFVDSLARQGEQAMNLEAGQSTYFESLFQAQQEQGRRAAEFMGVGRDLQDHADLENEIAGLLGEAPDPQFSPAGMLAQEVGDRASFMQGAEDPRWTAYSGLPAEQRAEVGPWLSQKGQMPMPAILGAGMPALDPKVLLANQMGLPQEDQYMTFLRSIGAAPSAGMEAQLGYNREALEARIGQAEKALTAREELAAAQHAARIAEIKATQDAITARAGGANAPATVDSAVKAVAEGFAAQQKAAMDRIKALPSDERQKALAATPIPSPPPASVQLQASRDFKAKGLSPEDAAAEFERLWSLHLARAGYDPNRAAQGLSAYFKSIQTSRK